MDLGRSFMVWDLKQPQWDGSILTLRTSQVITTNSLLQQLLTKVIVTTGIPCVVIIVDIDKKCQHQLEKMNAINQIYIIIMQMITLCMRSLDCRSHTVPIILVIAKSFKISRSNIQVLNRLIGFGDKCSRETFTDVYINVTVAEQKLSIQYFKFIKLLIIARQFSSQQLLSLSARSVLKDMHNYLGYEP
ncbi:UNKNOWN [Stylonychia lemnae]|uniref:Uncharacterized protein n=1 Tax=Stylonychia lemnae TaxID=5949 RepID=A0A077ZXL9_STYLE|nr:UNKNOWN [Stylonychia lemnae]|eukprot:CDW74656.1 UNKNOWN [Stylonychia lemnae]